MSTRRLPEYLIIGAQKSGTTALHRWLSAHPEIFTPSTKELHFFDRHFDEGISWYEDHFVDAHADQVTGEATPEYVYLDLAVNRMARTVPDAKLVLLLRDPVDRAYSHYHHEKSRDKEELSFGAALDAEAQRLGSTDDPILLARYSYADRGRYVSQVRRLLELYSREQVKIELFENLRDHPKRTFRGIAEFVGADPSILPPNVGTQANRYKSNRVRAIRRMLPAKIPFREALRAFERRSVRDYDAMPEAERQRLLELYLPERDELAGLTGCDLSSWQR